MLRIDPDRQITPLAQYREAHPEGYAYSQFCEIYRRWA